MDRDLVLNAIQPLRHLDVERTGAAPTDGCSDQNDIGPEDQRFIDRVELIGGIHLRDRAGPSAGMSALRVVAFASAEAQIVETDQARLDARGAGMVERCPKQVFGCGIARKFERS